jgi:hypothetical protein
MKGRAPYLAVVERKLSTNLKLITTLKNIPSLESTRNARAFHLTRNGDVQ